MDIDSQVEEFDSSSSDSSSSSEDEKEPQCEEEEMSESQEEGVGPEEDSDQGFTAGGLSSVEGARGVRVGGGAKGDRKRKKYRKRSTAGLRKKLRTHYESVEDFNPEARSAQSAELERIRRLELQRGITSPTLHPPPHTTNSYILSAQQTASYNVTVPSSEYFRFPQLASSAEGVPCESGEGVKQEGGDSSELVMVDLTHLTHAVKSESKTAPPPDTIVIDSGSDSDSNIEKGLPPSADVQSAAKVKGTAQLPQPSRPEALHRKYDDPTVPRPDGKLIVNVDHPPSESVVFLAPQLARIIKPHQIGGIRFLYDNIIESLDRYTSSPGFGCILAHSMGLGKTLQVISFIDIFMRYTPAKHVLCVVPVNTLQNWINEFNQWLPTQPSASVPLTATAPSMVTQPQTSNENLVSSHVTGLPLSGVQYRTFGVYILSEGCRSMEARVKVISEWREVGGVLLIGYEMFRLLSLSKPSLAGNKMAVKRRKNTPLKADKEMIDLDENEREMDALIGIQQALCDPGPDLVVCDEGHRIKNDYTNISQALKRIRTRRRIVMTGYPLQNNLIEYWCMVDFVRPKYLGTKQEFADLFERPITNGQCADSTPNDVRLMRYRSHVLHSLLEGFVLRRGHEILKCTLPPKFEHVLFLRPSEVQATLYNYNMSLIQQGGGVSAGTGPLKAFAVCTKIWNHPDIYYNEVVAQGAKKPSLKTLLDDAGLPKSALSGLKTGGESSCKIEWPNTLLPTYQPGLIEHSPKMAVLMQMIEHSVHHGDKILVFSQSLSTLTYVEKLLCQRQVPLPQTTLLSGNKGVQYRNETWKKNKNFCRIDGSTGSIERDRLISFFNSSANQHCWVFLLSTKAGCLGINLIGANRVVVLDVSWNPCYDAQAVCRVYRYGQTKPCYIYRLVCDGTMERKIYDRQISKQGMSDRVVDHLQPERHLSTQDILNLITPLTALPASCDLSPFAPKFLFDPLLVELCCSHGNLLTKLPFKHESLLIDSADERMTEVEKYIALRGFQQEWKALKSGPGSLQEFRNLQQQQARPTGVPGSSLKQPTHPQRNLTAHPATPPSSYLAPITAQLMSKSLTAPVTKQPNKEIEIICLDSDEEDKTGDTVATPTQPHLLQISNHGNVPGHVTDPNQPGVSPVQTQHGQDASVSMQPQNIPLSFYSQATADSANHAQTVSQFNDQLVAQPVTSETQVSDQTRAALSSFLKVPATLEPAVTSAQLTVLAEDIADTLKSQLLTTSLTRCQQDETKMATTKRRLSVCSELTDPKRQDRSTSKSPTVTAASTSSCTIDSRLLVSSHLQQSSMDQGQSLLSAPSYSQTSTPVISLNLQHPQENVSQPVCTNKPPNTAAPTETRDGQGSMAESAGSSMRYNSNTNNATEECANVFPQGKFLTVTTSRCAGGIVDNVTKSTVSVSNVSICPQSSKSQSEKSKKSSKKDLYLTTPTWSPPSPPPPPPPHKYTPSTIPLLSPIAAHLLYLSTGTKLPSSPPEDVSKYPPIVSPAPSSPESVASPKGNDMDGPECSHKDSSSHSDSPCHLLETDQCSLSRLNPCKSSTSASVDDRVNESCSSVEREKDISKHLFPTPPDSQNGKDSYEELSVGKKVIQSKSSSPAVSGQRSKVDSGISSDKKGVWRKVKHSKGSESVHTVRVDSSMEGIKQSTVCVSAQPCPPHSSSSAQHSYTPHSYTPPSCTPPSCTPPSCTPHSYTPPSCTPHSYTPPSCTPHSYTPPSCTPHSYTPPSCTPPSYTPPSCTQHTDRAITDVAPMVCRSLPLSLSENKTSSMSYPVPLTQPMSYPTTSVPLTQPMSYPTTSAHLTQSMSYPTTSTHLTQSMSYPTTSVHLTQSMSYLTTSVHLTQPMSYPTTSVHSTQPMSYPTTSVHLTQSMSYPTTSVHSTRPMSYPTTSVPLTQPMSYPTTSVHLTQPMSYPTTSAHSTQSMSYPTTSAHSTQSMSYPTTSVHLTQPMSYPTTSAHSTQSMSYPTTSAHSTQSMSYPTTSAHLTQSMSYPTTSVHLTQSMSYPTTSAHSTHSMSYPTTSVHLTQPMTYPTTSAHLTQAMGIASTSNTTSLQPFYYSNSTSSSSGSEAVTLFSHQPQTVTPCVTSGLSFVSSSSGLQQPLSSHSQQLSMLSSVNTSMRMASQQLSMPSTTKDLVSVKRTSKLQVPFSGNVGVTSQPKSDYGFTAISSTSNQSPLTSVRDSVVKQTVPGDISVSLSHGLLTNSTWQLKPQMNLAAYLTAPLPKAHVTSSVTPKGQVTSAVTPKSHVTSTVTAPLLEAHVTPLPSSSSDNKQQSHTKGCCNDIHRPKGQSTVYNDPHKSKVEDNGIHDSLVPRQPCASGVRHVTSNNSQYTSVPLSSPLVTCTPSSSIQASHCYSGLKQSNAITTQDYVNLKGRRNSSNSPESNKSKWILSFSESKNCDKRITPERISPPANTQPAAVNPQPMLSVENWTQQSTPAIASSSTGWPKQLLQNNTTPESSIMCAGSLRSDLSDKHLSQRREYRSPMPENMKLGSLSTSSSVVNTSPKESQGMKVRRHSNSFSSHSRERGRLSEAQTNSTCPSSSRDARFQSTSSVPEAHVCPEQSMSTSGTIMHTLSSLAPSNTLTTTQDVSNVLLYDSNREFGNLNTQEQQSQCLRAIHPISTVSQVEDHKSLQHSPCSAQLSKDGDNLHMFFPRRPSSDNALATFPTNQVPAAAKNPSSIQGGHSNIPIRPKPQSPWTLSQGVNGRDLISQNVVVPRHMSGSPVRKSPTPQNILNISPGSSCERQSLRGHNELLSPTLDSSVMASSSLRPQTLQSASNVQTYSHLHNEKYTVPALPFAGCRNTIDSRMATGHLLHSNTVTSEHGFRSNNVDSYIATGHTSPQNTATMSGSKHVSGHQSGSTGKSFKTSTASGLRHLDGSGRKMSGTTNDPAFLQAPSGGERQAGTTHLLNVSHLPSVNLTSLPTIDHLLTINPPNRNTMFPSNSTKLQSNTNVTNTSLPHTNEFSLNERRVSYNKAAASPNRAPCFSSFDATNPSNSLSFLSCSPTLGSKLSNSVNRRDSFDGSTLTQGHGATCLSPPPSILPRLTQTKLSNSVNRRDSFDGSTLTQGHGATCLSPPPSILPHLARTKKTAIVSPYCVVSAKDRSTEASKPRLTICEDPKMDRRMSLGSVSSLKQGIVPDINDLKNEAVSGNVQSYTYHLPSHRSKTVELETRPLSYHSTSNQCTVSSTAAGTTSTKNPTSSADGLARQCCYNLKTISPNTPNHLASLENRTESVCMRTDLASGNILQSGTNMHAHARLASSNNSQMNTIQRAPNSSQHVATPVRDHLTFEFNSNIQQASNERGVRYPDNQVPRSTLDGSHSLQSSSLCSEAFRPTLQSLRPPSRTSSHSRTPSLTDEYQLGSGPTSCGYGEVLNVPEPVSLSSRAAGHHTSQKVVRSGQKLKNLSVNCHSPKLSPYQTHPSPGLTSPCLPSPHNSNQKFVFDQRRSSPLMQMSNSSMETVGQNGIHRSAVSQSMTFSPSQGGSSMETGGQNGIHRSAVSQSMTFSPSQGESSNSDLFTKQLPQGWAANEDVESSSEHQIMTVLNPSVCNPHPPARSTSSPGFDAFKSSNQFTATLASESSVTVADRQPHKRAYSNSNPILKNFHAATSPPDNMPTKNRPPPQTQTCPSSSLPVKEVAATSRHLFSPPTSHFASLIPSLYGRTAASTQANKPIPLPDPVRSDTNLSLPRLPSFNQIHDSPLPNRGQRSHITDVSRRHSSSVTVDQVSAEFSGSHGSCRSGVVFGVATRMCK